MRSNLLISVFAFLIFAQNGFTQSPPYFRNDALATINGADLTPGSASVDGAGRISIGAITPGTGATNLGKAQDAAYTGGDIGVMALGVRNDASAALIGGNFEYGAINLSNDGAVRSNITSVGQNSAATGLLKAANSTSYTAADSIVGLGARTDSTYGAAYTNNRYAVPGMNLNGGLYAQPVGSNAGGSTTYSKISTANDNATNIKNGAGTVYSIQASNVNAAVRYVKFYNKATAPTCGHDVPVLRVAIPPTSAADTPITFPTGAAFSLGIGICIVTGITDADDTATAASEQLVNITYN